MVLALFKMIIVKCQPKNVFLTVFYLIHTMYDQEKICACLFFNFSRETDHNIYLKT